MATYKEMKVGNEAGAGKPTIPGYSPNSGPRSLIEELEILSRRKGMTPISSTKKGLNATGTGTEKYSGRASFSPNSQVVERDISIIPLNLQRLREATSRSTSSKRSVPISGDLKGDIRRIYMGSSRGGRNLPKSGVITELADLCTSYINRKSSSQYSLTPSAMHTNTHNIATDQQIRHLTPSHSTRREDLPHRTPRSSGEEKQQIKKLRHKIRKLKRISSKYKTQINTIRSMSNPPPRPTYCTPGADMCHKYEYKYSEALGVGTQTSTRTSNIYKNDIYSHSKKSGLECPSSMVLTGSPHPPRKGKGSESPYDDSQYIPTSTFKQEKRVKGKRNTGGGVLSNSNAGLLCNSNYSSNMHSHTNSVIIHCPPPTGKLVQDTNNNNSRESKFLNILESLFLKYTRDSSCKLTQSEAYGYIRELGKLTSVNLKEGQIEHLVRELEGGSNPLQSNPSVPDESINYSHNNYSLNDRVISIQQMKKVIGSHDNWSSMHSTSGNLENSLNLNPPNPPAHPIYPQSCRASEGGRFFSPLQEARGKGQHRYQPRDQPRYGDLKHLCNEYQTPKSHAHPHRDPSIRVISNLMTQSQLPPKILLKGEESSNLITRPNTHESKYIYKILNSNGMKYKKALKTYTHSLHLDLRLHANYTHIHTHALPLPLPYAQGQGQGQGQGLNEGTLDNMRFFFYAGHATQLTRIFESSLGFKGLVAPRNMFFGTTLDIAAPFIR